LADCNHIVVLEKMYDLLLFFAIHFCPI
jgi:hypothetical protein